ncbi:MAG: hypothetical protein FK733_15130, partial [Asgard group archaeon]|nr:hypothetical protein [Asgard group archaeon]
MRKIKPQIYTLIILLFLFIIQFSSSKMNADCLQNNNENISFLTLADDTYEDDDNFISAKDIALNSAQVRNISPTADVDYAKFVLDDFSKVTIETSGTTGDTR